MWTMCGAEGICITLRRREGYNILITVPVEGKVRSDYIS